MYIKVIILILGLQLAGFGYAEDNPGARDIEWAKQLNDEIDSIGLNEHFYDGTICLADDEFKSIYCVVSEETGYLEKNSIVKMDGVERKYEDLSVEEKFELICNECTRIASHIVNIESKDFIKVMQKDDRYWFRLSLNSINKELLVDVMRYEVLLGKVFSNEELQQLVLNDEQFKLYRRYKNEDLTEVKAKLFKASDVKR
ncbi:hypothetical protein A3715_10210 [Oleiphilus sp. HI0009]|nr:hypothetical protein A3715_10210 [Oleiphilus sp. HI0009]